jgi:MFS family permease
MQWATNWADQLTGGTQPTAKAYTQCCSAFGAILGTVGGALLGGRFGRRLAYTLLCLGALGSAFFFFQGNSQYGPRFLASVFLAGGFSASFYGWLPLYLPELFATPGQGFSYNFGRILAAVGSLQMGSLVGLFGNDYPRAGSVIVGMYVLGLVLIWFAPETHGQPLHDG